MLLVLLLGLLSDIAAIGVKERIVNPAYREAQNTNAPDPAEPPSPWVHTLSDGKKSIVTPTVIASVTFYARPPEHTNGLEPWISLKKDGIPVTIRPEIKNGITKKGRPDYGTYFASPTTILHDNTDIVAHTLLPGEVFKEVKWVPQDSPEHWFDPLMRCTPASYFKKGMGRDISSEPFCFPRDDVELKLEKTYFVTWYSKFFDPSVAKVNLHLSRVIPSAMRKGFKRDEEGSLGPEDDNVADLDQNNRQGDIDKRLVEIEKGGSISKSSFFQSGWISNTKGWYALNLNEDMFPPHTFTQKVAISLQPDNVDTKDFDPLANYVVVTLSKRSKVAKGSLRDLKKLEQKLAGANEEFEEYTGINYDEYIVMMTLPTCVLLFGLLMYCFVRVNKGMTDLSHLKRHRLIRKAKGVKRRERELPRYFSNSSKHD